MGKNNSNRVFKIPLCLIGGISSILIILSSLMIWICLFDNDGGEPGAETIFRSIFLWPIFLIAIVMVGLRAATRPYIASIAAAAACIFLAVATVLTLRLRERNTEANLRHNKSSMVSPISREFERDFSSVSVTLKERVLL